jgi:hypothetical protein
VFLTVLELSFKRRDRRIPNMAMVVADANSPPAIVVFCRIKIGHQTPENAEMLQAVLVQAAAYLLQQTGGQITVDSLDYVSGEYYLTWAGETHVRDLPNLTHRISGYIQAIDYQPHVVAMGNLRVNAALAT